MAAQPSADNELDLRRPFTRADAIRAGLDPKILRGSRFRRLFRGVYVLRSVPVSPILRTEAALALHPPDAFASHLSAARVLGLPVPDGPGEHVSVFDQRDRRTRPGILAHVAPASARVVSYKGLRVSAPLHTFVDLAGVLSLVDLVVVGDALVRVFRLDPEQLVAACEASGSRYAAAAARAARLVRRDVDSPMESRLRMLIVLAGLPEPEVNHTIRDEYGAVIARLDLSYPHLKLLEYDGRQHAESSARWLRDLERREMFDDNAWRILVVTANGIYKEPERTLQRIRAALVSRGSTSLPRHLSEEWRAYFPERP